MRAWIAAFGLVALLGCGEPPPCGVDNDGNDVPWCAVTFEGISEPINFCPLEHWAADDDCNTCGCSDDGRIVCTALQCGTGPTTGTSSSTGTTGTTDTGLGL